MRRPREASEEASADVDLEPHDLVGLFVAPKWLRDLGMSAWLAVGVTLALVGLVWILSLTNTIVAPVITAAVIATVASPLVRRQERRGIGRGVAAALLLGLTLVLAVF